MLSVRLTTFNHESFIRAAMDSIFAQQTDFQVEIVAGDDFSTDKTMDIIRSYTDTDKVKVTILNRVPGDTYSKHRKAFGRLHNFFDTLQNCKGEYVAILDGDDYWADKFKLQKQVDFLNSNKEYMAISSDSRHLRNGELKDTYKEAKESWLKYSFPRDITYQDILFRAVPHLSTFVFRNKVSFPEKYSSYPIGDLPLFLLLADLGKIRFVDEVTSVYRIQPASAIAELNKRDALGHMKDINEMVVDVNRFLGSKYQEHTEAAIIQDYRRLLLDRPSFDLKNRSIRQLNELKEKKILNRFDLSDRMGLSFALFRGIFLQSKYALSSFIRKGAHSLFFAYA